MMTVFKYKKVPKENKKVLTANLRTLYIRNEPFIKEASNE